MTNRVYFQHPATTNSEGMNTARGEPTPPREIRPLRRAVYACIGGLALLLAAPLVFASGEIEWHWTARQPSGAIVRQDSGTLVTTLTSPSIALDEPKAFVAGIGALATSLEITVNGQVDPTHRSIGAGVEIIAKETPWDERRPPGNSSRKIGVASVHSMLTDTLELSSLSANIAHGFATNFITMNLRPSQFDGLLSAPIIHPAAGSSIVDIILDFLIFENLPGGGLTLLHHRPFSKQLSSVDGGLFQISSSGPIPDPDPLGSGRIPLANGRSHTIVMSMTATVSLTGSPFPAQDPERLNAQASFNNTFSFGGFFDFQDQNGIPLTDVIVASGSGIDWLSPLPVPLPGSLALLACGLPLLAVLTRRRRS